MGWAKQLNSRLETEINKRITHVRVCKEMRTKNMVLEDELEKLKKENEEAETALAAFNSSIDSLKSKASDLEVCLDEAQSMNKSLRGDLNEATESKAEQSDI